MKLKVTIQSKQVATSNNYANFNKTCVSICILIEALNVSSKYKVQIDLARHSGLPVVDGSRKDFEYMNHPSELEAQALVPYPYTCILPYVW